MFWNRSRAGHALPSFPHPDRGLIARSCLENDADLNLLIQSFRRLRVKPSKATSTKMAAARKSDTLKQASGV
jgi:hypothetical protein